MSDEELTLCPFCGGTARLQSILRDGCKDGEPDAWAYFALCYSCAAQGPWMKSLSGAARLWNTRPGMDGLRAEAARLRGLNHEAAQALADDNVLLQKLSTAERELADGARALIEENGRLRAVLKQYADLTNWNTEGRYNKASVWEGDSNAGYELAARALVG